jgi:hypothetical protein
MQSMGRNGETRFRNVAFLSRRFRNVAFLNFHDPGVIQVIAASPNFG